MNTMAQTCTSCIFCEIIKAKDSVLYQDDIMTVIRDKKPDYPTHLLLLPNIHIESLLHVKTDYEITVLSYIMTHVATIAHKFKLAEWKTLINTGYGAGQRVFHLHVHIMSHRKIVHT